MRTKTLLIAATALAVTALSSSAQTYSQNIVGYTTTTLAVGLNLVVPTIQVTSSNNAEQVFPCLQSGDVLFLWNGSGFDQALFNGPNDWYNNYTFDSINAPLLPLGAGLYYQNNGSVVTNTFTGTVVLSNNVPMAVGLNLVGSTAPVGGSAESTNFALPLVSGDVLFLWNGSGFDQVLFNGPGDWYNNYTFDSIPAPNLSVGAAFYYQNNNSASTWQQNVIVP